MTVRPTEDMYGKRVGVIVDSRVLSGHSLQTSVDLRLEGVLSLEGCRKRNMGEEPSFDHAPHQIILEEVTCPNLYGSSKHPLNGVPKIFLDNAYVIGLYTLTTENKPDETGGVEQPE